jgi:hypothetical protein
MVCLIEDEDDVTRKRLAGCGDCNFAHPKWLWVVIPGPVSALLGFGFPE